MPKLTITRLADKFEYKIDASILVKEQETLFLTALSEYIPYDFSNESNWSYERSVPDPGSVQTSYTGLDGRQFKIAFPAFFFERIETGIDPMMGSAIYSFNRIYNPVWDGSDWIIPSNEIYVNTAMGKETLEAWMNRELFVGTATSSASSITGIKEVNTGFILPASKLPILLSLTGEPFLTSTPSEILGAVKLIRTLFEIRASVTKSISSEGEIV